MNKKSLRSQQGIALLQVLLLSAIISILAIRFSVTARDQIKISAAFEQRVKATQLLKSTKKQIFYTLLTQKPSQSNKLLFPNSEAWNFYGQPFTLVDNSEQKIVVSIQDNAGLLSQQNSTSPLWRQVLLNIGYSETAVKKIQGQLKDWQDRDNNSWILGNTEPSALPGGQTFRNQPIQLPQEIAWFFTEQTELIPTIKHISTSFAGAGVNFLHAPDLLISLFFEAEIASEIIRLRNLQQLTTNEMITMLGDAYDDELISFFPGNQFKIVLQVSLADVALQETVEILIQPRQVEPILIFFRY
ncbi:MAG: general secretion pathway protein K [Psychroserpens sp.]|jgi:general secretion pathway protein K